MATTSSAAVPPPRARARARACEREGANPAITLDDLDRDELLALIRRRAIFSFSTRDLWSARWHILSHRALVASEAEGRASIAYTDALAAFAEPGLAAWERGRRARRAQLLKARWQAAERVAKAARTADEAAWAALEACA